MSLSDGRDNVIALSPGNKYALLTRIRMFIALIRDDDGDTDDVKGMDQACLYNAQPCILMVLFDDGALLPHQATALMVCMEPKCLRSGS